MLCPELRIYFAYRKEAPIPATFLLSLAFSQQREGTDDECVHAFREFALHYGGVAIVRKFRFRGGGRSRGRVNHIRYGDAVEGDG